MVCGDRKAIDLAGDRPGRRAAPRHAAEDGHFGPASFRKQRRKTRIVEDGQCLVHDPCALALAERTPVAGKKAARGLGALAGRKIGQDWADKVAKENKYPWFAKVLKSQQDFEVQWKGSEGWRKVKVKD